MAGARAAHSGRSSVATCATACCSSAHGCSASCVLGVFPILYTFYLSLTRYSGIKEPIFIGAQNYERMFGDPLFWKAIYNTFYYTLLAVPIGVVVAMVLALAMNQRIREIAIYRAVFYLPSILPVFAISFIFIIMLNPGYGLVNTALGAVGLPVAELARRSGLHARSRSSSSHSSAPGSTR